MFEFTAVSGVAPPLFRPAATRLRPVATWDEAVESLLAAVSKKAGAGTRVLAEAAPWSILLDPTAGTCLNRSARSAAEEDSGAAAALSAAGTLLCTWSEGFSRSTLFLRYDRGAMTRRFVVVGGRVEVADGVPQPGEPPDLATMDAAYLAAVVRAAGLDMDRVRATGRFAVVEAGGRR